MKKGRFSTFLFVLWAGGCAFLCYSMVYGLRKPFTAATFDDFMIWGYSFKSVIAIAQVIGYAISKFAGIKLISELNHKHRLRFIATAAIIATVSLVFFGLLPMHLKVIAMFFNGLALGVMWGVIFTFLEGRRITDLLASILGISIVLSSGMAKSFGLFVMNQLYVCEFWMPAAIGLIACPLVVALGWTLSKLPEPDAEDIELRVERVTLNGSERIALFYQYALLLTLLISGNMLLTVLRDIKEDFVVNILDLSGQSDWMLAGVSATVTLIILLLFGLMVLVRKNKNALMILLTGSVISSVCMVYISWNYHQLNLPPVLWLFVMGLSLYIPYLAFQTIFFDRFIAFFRISGNVGFFIYLIDSTGYAGSVVMLLIKELVKPDVSWLDVFNRMGVMVGIYCAIVFAISLIIIARTKK